MIEGVKVSYVADGQMCRCVMVQIRVKKRVS